MFLLFSGKKWALRVLRWVLVVDPEASDVEEIKKCFLMAVRVNKYYETKLEIGLEKLFEKISFYLNVRDDKLLVYNSINVMIILIIILIIIICRLWL